MDVVLMLMVGYIKLCLVCLALFGAMIAYDMVRWRTEMYPPSRMNEDTNDPYYQDHSQLN